MGFCYPSIFKLTFSTFTCPNTMTQQSRLSTFIAELRRRRVFRVAADSLTLLLADFCVLDTVPIRASNLDRFGNITSV